MIRKEINYVCQQGFAFPSHHFNPCGDLSQIFNRLWRNEVMAVTENGRFD